MAYDELRGRRPTRASREYLEILHLAAQETESGVDEALRLLLAREEAIDPEAVKRLLAGGEAVAPATAVAIDAVDLSCYDALLAEAEVFV
jgi:hypothetical protein